MHSNTLANPQVDDIRIGSLVVVVVAAVVVVAVVVSIVVSAAAVPAVVVASPPREPEAQGKIVKMKNIARRHENYRSTAQKNVQSWHNLPCYPHRHSKSEPDLLEQEYMVYYDETWSTATDSTAYT